MTSDNLPAVRNDEPREVTRADTDSWIQVVGEVAKFAGYIAGTEFVPRSLRDNPAAATAAIMYGREVGLPPMTALTQTHVIEGRPSLSSEGMRALVLAAGHEIEVIESTGAVCRMRARRRGSERWSSEVVWTIDMARAAGLLNKNNWKNYPRQMLSARTSAELCTLHFPDVTLGFKSVEELEDLGGEEGNALMPGKPAASGSTKVARKRAPTKQALPAAPERPAEQPDAPVAPPLPGEDGYEDLAPSGAPNPGDGETSAGESDDGSSATHAEESGEDNEDTPADVVDGETVDEPTDNTGGPETAGAGDATVPGVAAGEPAPAEDPPSGRKASRAQHRMIFAQLEERGVDPKDDEERLLVASKIVGRPIGSFNDLLVVDATRIVDTLARTKTREQLWALLDEIDAAAAENGDES